MSRVDRMNEEIRYQISTILQTQTRDPRIGFVTITKVDTSPDFRQALVYFTVINADDGARDTLEGLKASSGFIRSLLAKRIRVKFIPRITFIHDVPPAESKRIDDIINMLHREKEIG
ncbi:MAG: 30S ribosome-binding factor RbfA [Candidatus Omnitrophica bacterium]|nr:30S ribosome-binding factor RbfA [Candidatus Omnitrophota bacterium]